MEHPSYNLVLLAAGSGTRFGGDVPKQWTVLGDRPVVQWSLECFLADNRLHNLVLVVAQPFLAKAQALVAEKDPGGQRCRVVCGGDSREESTRAGLLAHKHADPSSVVLIHDAARPLVNHQVVDRVTQAVANGSHAVVPVLPVSDTLKDISSGTTVDRSQLCRAQTPQGFPLGLILAAHETRLVGTDDASLVEQLGHKITMVPGCPRMHKLTTAEDHAYLQALVSL